MIREPCYNLDGILFYRKCADLFSDGTFKQGMSVKMNKGSKYTSVLRVWEPLPGDDRKYDEILDLCKKHPNAFDSVLFFTQNNHSVRNPETHRATAKSFVPCLNASTPRAYRPASMCCAPSDSSRTGSTRSWRAKAIRTMSLCPDRSRQEGCVRNMRSTGTISPSNTGFMPSFIPTGFISTMISAQ